MITKNLLNNSLCPFSTYDFFVFCIIFHSITFWVFFKWFATYGCRHPYFLYNYTYVLSLDLNILFLLSTFWPFIYISLFLSMIASLKFHSAIFEGVRHCYMSSASWDGVCLKSMDTLEMRCSLCFTWKRPGVLMAKKL